MEMNATVRFYLRRSRNDEGKQQYSLDVQRAGCREFAEREDLADGSGFVEYLDDGKAGDDFHRRVGIRRLIADAKPGDVIVCRDQSRLGRDAIEVTLVIRDLVREHGCLLYYYASGQRVQFENAIDQATTFIRGTGHQMELEAIRSRTREALRARVGAGKVAGFLNLTPLFGVVLASILLDEALTSAQGLGGTLILVGIICANYSPRQFKALVAKASER